MKGVRMCKRQRERGDEIDKINQSQTETEGRERVTRQQGAEAFANRVAPHPHPPVSLSLSPSPPPPLSLSPAA